MFLVPRIPDRSVPPRAAAAAPAGRGPVMARTGWREFRDFVAASGARGAAQYDSWMRRRGNDARKVSVSWDDCLGVFGELTHEALYALAPEDFDARARRIAGCASEHALGAARKQVASARGMADWSPPVPITWVFHTVLERLGRIPAWSDIETFVAEGDGRRFVLDPLYRTLRLDPSLPLDPLAAEAFRFRMGNFYYGLLREARALVELRCVHRLDARYHFLVDAEWKADLWCGDVLVEMYVPNGTYKDREGRTGYSGRKVPCRVFNPGREVFEAEMRGRLGYGKAWFFAADDVAAMADRLKRAGCPLLP